MADLELEVNWRAVLHSEDIEQHPKMVKRVIKIAQKGPVLLKHRDGDLVMIRMRDLADLVRSAARKPSQPAPPPPTED